MLSANPWSHHTAGLLESKTQAFRSFWLSASKSGKKISAPYRQKNMNDNILLVHFCSFNVHFFKVSVFNHLIRKKIFIVEDVV